MVDAVAFDFGQTLVNSADGFRSAEHRAQRSIFKALGLGAWEEFISGYRSVRARRMKGSRFSRQEMWREVIARHGGHVDEVLLDQWEREYWKTVEQSTQPFPEAKSVLEKLGIRYRLAVITNTQRQLAYDVPGVSQFNQLESYFEVIVIAGSAGIPPKPDPKPFLTCLERLGLSPDRVVYVGDDWAVDIAGAQNVGIRPIWLKHHSVVRNWPEVTTDVPVISSLNELLDPIIFDF